MAELVITGSFVARHGTRVERSSHFDVEAKLVGPIIGDFVAGIDDNALKATLREELSHLDGVLLDDIVGRATLENVAAYLLARLHAVGVRSVVVGAGDTRVHIDADDVDVESFAVELTFKRGVSLLLRGRPKEALEALTLASHLSPSLAAVHVARGRALRRLGRLEEALCAFDAAVAADLSCGEAHRNRGNVLLELDRGREAVESLGHAISLLPKSALAHNNRGYALRKLGEFQLALVDHDRAVELDPEYEEAYRDRAEVRARLGMPDLAREDLTRAETLCGIRDEVELERAKLMNVCGTGVVRGEKG